MKLSQYESKVKIQLKRIFKNDVNCGAINRFLTNPCDRFNELCWLL